MDREDTLKKAEKLLRQGRLDAAIAEYLRVVEDQPRDWTTANTLGDLYGRAGQADKAIAQYGRIADHFAHDGFYPKAAALYRKILKIAPGDEPTQLKLAEISSRQGLLADARAHFNAVLTKRRARGDRKGADEIVIRLGEIDPADLEARMAAARVLAEQGDAASAGAILRALHQDLAEKGRDADALAALREASRINPADTQARASLARMAVSEGDFDGARAYLDRDTAGGDPDLLLALATIELRSDRLEEAREILVPLARSDASIRQAVIELAGSLTATAPAAAFVCIDAAVDAAVAVSNCEDAAALLQEFASRLPDHVPALLKLVEVSVDGGLESTMYEAQAQLADAYLTAGQAAEARVIAEDLVAREPWERAHIERFRRALVMLRVSEPDSVIAERLSGQSPFTATDLFVGTTAEPPVAETHGGGHAVVPDEAPAPPEERPGPPPPPAPPPASPRPPAKEAGTAEIDLTNALEEPDGGPESPSPVAGTPQPATLEDVFKRLRTTAAAEPGAGADEAAQTLDLARTYLDMGMTAEAAVALRTAARSPRHRFVSATLLGQVSRDQGDLLQAVEWLERAVEAPAPGVEEGRAVLYELGILLELIGETARALALFMELQADAGNYRDVAARVDHLARVQTGG